MNLEEMAGRFLSTLLKPFDYSPSPVALLCLVHQLSRFLGMSHRYDITWYFAEFVESPSVEDVIAQLDECKAKLLAQGYRIPDGGASRSDSNPIEKIGLEDNPVSAYLFQNRKHSGAALGVGLRLLYLSRCWSSLNHERKTAAEFALELRKADIGFLRENERAAFLAELKRVPTDSFEAEFKSYISGKTEAVAWKKLPSSFRRSLLFLVENTPARSFPSTKGGKPDGGSSEKDSSDSAVGNFRQGPFGFPLATEDSPPPRYPVQRLFVEPLSEVPPGEAPRTVSVVVLDPGSVEQESFDVDLGAARRWLQGIQNKTTISAGVFSDMELRRVQDYLSTLESVSTHEKLESRLLVGLSLALGKDIRDILSMSCGAKGVINSRGLVSMSIIRPESCFQPTSNDQPFRGILEMVQVRLPDPLDSVVSKYASTLKPMPLSECLRTPAPKLYEAISRDMEELIMNGTYDISYGAIASALSAEIQLRTESPLFVFHLTRKKGEVMPSLGWYQALTDEQIREAYRESASYLFHG